MANTFRRADKKHYAQPRSCSKALVSIEPHQLWTIRILYKFSLISKEELANLLEAYIDAVNRKKANIDENSERESDNYLITLEPTRWKEQDHYLVLGLQNLRYKASEDDIKRAHRRKALRHHPDKRGKTSVDLESDYYACITRAIEILGDPVKRRSFDSVDPTFDETIPNSIKHSKLEQNPNLFFKTFGDAFRLNSRWSNKNYVPEIGDLYTPRQQVERFYEFWYDFQSWREFSYLDEEDKEKGENRDERRWLDRQNKATRLQRKKMENQRIRQLVDNAYSCDPRVAKFRDEDKQRKIDSKKAKQAEARERVEREEAEKARIEEEERQKKLAMEEEEKRKRLEEKKQRDQTKKDTKRAVKGLEEIFKANDYFVTNQRDKIKHIEELDKLTKMLSLEDIREFRDEIDHCQEFKDKQAAFLTRVDGMNKKLDEEKRKLMEKSSNNVNTSESNKSKVAKWTEEEIKLLVKSVNTFPAGTKDRWEVIAQYMAQHSINTVHRDAKQVLAKVKQIQEQLAKRKAN